ncbi:phage head-tail connector protein [Virgibacillus salexigens]|uniref:phage head-tail connector protein n=1 Tax=Virgibacillus salexigens TaxID=61016 RepID=UPI003081F8AA
MDQIVTNALALVKARLGITSTVRDEYLSKIIEGVAYELSEVNGLSLSSDNSFQLMFVVDLSTWRYQNRDESGSMPRHLKFRLHNLIINGGGNDGNV